MQQVLIYSDNYHLYYLSDNVYEAKNFWGFEELIPVACHLGAKYSHGKLHEMLVENSKS